MTLFPPLSIDWLNGWIPGTLFYLVFFILLKIFPKETVDRLYDNSGWTLDQARPAKIGLPFALAALILLPFTPFKDRSAHFLDWPVIIFAGFWRIYLLSPYF